MLTSQAVTGAGGIVVGYATLALVYLGVACAVAWILRRLARAPLRERGVLSPAPALDGAGWLTCTSTNSP